jgi:hypothetical protein
MYTNELAGTTAKSAASLPQPGSSVVSHFNLESVLSVHHWTDTLFSFTTTRDPSFRFRNGEFTMGFCRRQSRRARSVRGREGIRRTLAIADMARAHGARRRTEY